MGNRNTALDILKLVLAIFVIGIHCGLFSDVNQLLSYLTTNGVFRVAVPVFFIINGFYITRVFRERAIVQWVKRIIILYVAWMIIYRSFWFDPGNISETLLTILFGSNHLWYVVALILCGLVLYGARNLPLKNLIALALFLYIIGVVIQYAGNFHVFSDPKTDAWLNTVYIYRNFLFFGLPFFISGFAIERYVLYQKIPQNLMVILLCVGIVLLLAESYLMMRFANEGADLFISLLLVCPVVFMYFFNLNVTSKINSRQFSQMSTAIYLVHLLAMDKIEKWFLLSTTSLFIATTLFSIILSLLIMRINRYVKFLL